MSNFNDEEIDRIVELCNELLKANEELNAKIIAMDAYVRNGDAKIRLQKNYIKQLEALVIKYEYEKANNYNCPN